ncbi:MAG: translocation/assembly module TamB domain-containing protein [Pseudomonadales bacterium]
MISPATSTENKTSAVRKVTVRALVVFLLLVCLTISALFYFISTTSGSRFVVKQIVNSVAGLHMEVSGGNLWSGLGLKHLQWENDGLRIEVADIESKWTINCLSDLSFCIDSIAASTVTIDLIDSDNNDQAAAAKSIELAEIDFPIALNLSQLNVPELTIKQNGTETFALTKLSIESLSLINTELSLGQISLYHEERKSVLSGNMALTQNYPLTVSLHSELPQQLPALNLAIAGDLAKLELEFASWGEYPLQLHAIADVLDPQLPFSAQLTVWENFDYQYDDHRLTVMPGELRASGQMDSFDLEADFGFSHSMWSGEHSLKLQASITPEQALIDQLSLVLPDGQMGISGSINLDELVSSRIKLALTDINPMQFQPDQIKDTRLNGSVNAELEAVVNLAADGLEGSLSIESLTGVLGGRELSGRGAVSYNHSMLAMDSLALNLGDAFVQANGQISRSGGNSLIWKLHFPDVSRLIAHAQGNIDAEGQLTGKLLTPDINGNISLANFAWYDLDLEQASLNVQMKESGDLGTGIQLQITGLHIKPELPALNLKLLSSGPLLKQSLKVTIDAEDLGQIGLACDIDILSSWQQFKSQCNELFVSDIASDEENESKWEIREPLTAQLNLEQMSAGLSDWCLVNTRNNTQQLCNKQVVRWQNNGFSAAELRGTKLPLAWLKPFFNNTIDLSGALNLELVSAAFSAGEIPSIKADLTTVDLSLSWQSTTGEVLDVAVEAFEAHGEISGDDINASWLVESAELGEIHGLLSRKNQRLSATLLSQGLDLSPLAAFIPATRQFSGRLVSDITLSEDDKGFLIDGDLRVEDGQADIIGSPLPLDGFSLNAEFSGREARLSGNLDVDTGDIQLVGKADWKSNDWSADMHLLADNLLIEPMYRSNLHVNADLLLEAGPQNIKLSGDVSIPKARINIRELPTSAISPSQDTVLLHEEAEPSELWAVNTDLRLLLGDDVQFRGFGLYSKLKGNLQLRQQDQNPLVSSGAISLIDGRYKAYGQDLVIKDGRMIFSGPIDNPDVLIKAERNNRSIESITVGVLVEGQISAPELSLYSTPAMSDNDKIHFLLTGRMPDESSEQQGMMSQAVVSAGLASTNERAGEVASQMGINDFNIGTDTGESGQEAQMSGYLGPNLYLKYGYSIFEQTSAFTARYRLSDNIFVEAYSGKTSAVDILWRINRGAANDTESPIPLN